MRYFKIEGILEIPSTNFNVIEVTEEFIELIESIGATFGGGLKEVDSEGNDL